MFHSLHTDSVDAQHAEEPQFGDSLVGRATQHDVDAFTDILVDTNFFGNLFGQLAESDVVRIIHGRETGSEPVE